MDRTISGGERRRSCRASQTGACQGLAETEAEAGRRASDVTENGSKTATTHLRTDSWSEGSRVAGKTLVESEHEAVAESTSVFLEA